MSIRFITILILSIIGGAIKVVGGIFYGSKALIVDAFTSIANIIAAMLVIYYYNRARMPPDKDHMYGHHRLTIGGPIFTVVVYSTVFGIVFTDLLYNVGKEYVVSEYAPLMAFLGFIVYSIAILLSKGVDVSFKIYAKFTGGELIESIVTILASLSGAFISYLIDFTGAIILSLYIIYEIYVSVINMISVISDETSRDILNEIENELKRVGLDIERIRVRRIIENIYHGDIIVRFPAQTSVADAHIIVDEIEKALKDKYNIDITVHIEPK
jgi:divalent metal cation (Fe/Co/Zn/Cd) transporter